MNINVVAKTNHGNAAALTCDECGETKDAAQFCDPTASEPHCKECADGFWEMMGDDPCGKDWR